MKAIAVAVVILMSAPLLGQPQKFHPVFHEEKTGDATVFSRSFYASGEKFGEYCRIGISKGEKGLLIRTGRMDNGERLEQVIEVENGKQVSERWYLGERGDRREAPELYRYSLFVEYRDAAKKLPPEARRIFAGFAGIK